MIILIVILSIYIFLKTFFYGIFEYKEKSNKIAGTSIIILSIICLIAPTLVVLYSA